MSINIKSLVLKSLVVPVLLTTVTAYANNESRFKDGEQVYAKVCGHCHETGGDIGPVLSGRNLAPAYTTAIVRNGFRAMPAFAASFVDDKALAEVSEYIEKLPAAKIGRAHV